MGSPTISGWDLTPETVGSAVAVLTLGWAVLSTRSAQRDARNARAEAQAANERVMDLQVREIESGERMFELEARRDQAQQVDLRRAEVARWAEMQAARVWISSEWGGRHRRAWVDLKIHNRSGDPIERVRPYLEWPLSWSTGEESVEGFNPMPLQEGQTVHPGRSFTVLGGETLVLDPSQGPPDYTKAAPASAVFRDRFGNNWRITASNDLFLITPRALDTDPSPPSLLSDDDPAG